jgi:hypothetical protein
MWRFFPLGVESDEPDASALPSASKRDSPAQGKSVLEWDEQYSPRFLFLFQNALSPCLEFGLHIYFTITSQLLNKLAHALLSKPNMER